MNQGFTLILKAWALVFISADWMLVLTYTHTYNDTKANGHERLQGDQQDTKLKVLVGQGVQERARERGESLDARATYLL